MAFDWASQPYNTLLLTFIFAPYFATVVGDPTRAQTLWGLTLAIAGGVIALLAPILGALADGRGRRRPWIAGFSALYILGASALWFADPGADGVMLILVAFGLGLIGMEFATIFTNALLPTLGTRAEIGRISGSGWGLGYAGGVVALVIVLFFFAENDDGRTFLGTAPIFGLDPDTREGTRFVGPFTALWYAIFMVPFFLWVREPPATYAPAGSVRESLSELRRTLAGLPRRRSLFAYLGASMLYRDALNGMYTFGGLYALGVLGWSVVDVGVFGIVAATTGAVAAWAGGRADQAFGPLPVIRASILTLLLVAIAVTTISRESVLLFPVDATSPLPSAAFYVCGATIGAAGGTLQAASRTMLVHQGDPARMTEAFGLYALAGKATSFVAPAAISVATAATGSQRWGVSPLILLFLGGLVLLGWVKSDGDRAAWSPA